MTVCVDVSRVLLSAVRQHPGQEAYRAVRLCLAFRSGRGTPVVPPRPGEAVAAHTA